MINHSVKNETKIMFSSDVLFDLKSAVDAAIHNWITENRCVPQSEEEVRSLERHISPSPNAKAVAKANNITTTSSTTAAEELIALPEA